MYRSPAPIPENSIYKSVQVRVRLFYIYRSLGPLTDNSKCKSTSKSKAVREKTYQNLQYKPYPRAQPLCTAIHIRRHNTHPYTTVSK